MSRLDGKVVIVVGGAAGTGAGCSRRIALEGAEVIVADADAAAAASAAAKVREEGGSASAEEVEVGDEESVAALIERVVERHGRIDGLHNDPSAFRLGQRDTHLAELDTETWEDTLRVGLRGCMYTTKHAVPQMARAGGGAIVNVSSVTARSAQPMNPAYTIAKGGVLSLTAAVVASYGKHGIRCNAICPGFIVNEKTEGKFGDDFRAMVLTHVPHSRLGTPDDVGRLSAFLLSADADYISGQAISVDGGLGTPGSLYSDLPKPAL